VLFLWATKIFQQDSASPHYGNAECPHCGPLGIDTIQSGRLLWTLRHTTLPPLSQYCVYRALWSYCLRLNQHLMRLLYISRYITYC